MSHRRIQKHLVMSIIVLFFQIFSVQSYADVVVGCPVTSCSDCDGGQQQWCTFTACDGTQTRTQQNCSSNPGPIVGCPITSCGSTCNILSQKACTVTDCQGKTSYITVSCN